MALIQSHDYTALSGSDGAAVTTVTDGSGNSRTGTARGTVVLATDSLAVRCAYFNGTGAIDFAVGASDTYNTLLKSGSTMFFAVSMSAYNSFHQTLFFKASTFNDGFWFSYTAPSAQAYWLGLNNPNGSNSMNGGSVLIGDYAIVALTRTSGGALVGYVNGRRVTTSSSGAAATWRDASLPSMFLPPAAAGLSAFGFIGYVYRTETHDVVMSDSEVAARSQVIANLAAFPRIPALEATRELFIIGDSILRSSNTSQAFRFQEFETYLAATYGRNLSVVSGTVGGYTWAQIKTGIIENLNWLRNSLVAGRNYIVFLLTGDANTINGGATAAACHADFQAAVTAVRTAASAASATVTVICCTPMYAFSSGLDATMDAVAALRRAAGTGTSGGLPDVLIELTTSALNPRINASYFSDGTHLSATGRQIMMETLGLYVQTYLQSATTTTPTGGAMTEVFTIDNEAYTPVTNVGEDADIQVVTRGSVEAVVAASLPAVDTRGIVIDEKIAWCKSLSVAPTSIVYLKASNPGPATVVVNH